MTMEIEILRKDIRKQKFESEKLEMKNENLLSENQQLKSDLTISQEKLETLKTLEDQMEDLKVIIQKLSVHWLT